MAAHPIPNAFDPNPETTSYARDHITRLYCPVPSRKSSMATHRRAPTEIQYVPEDRRDRGRWIDLTSTEEDVDGTHQPEENSAGTPPGQVRLPIEWRDYINVSDNHQDADTDGAVVVVVGSRDAFISNVGGHALPPLTEQEFRELEDTHDALHRYVQDGGTFDTRFESYDFLS
ncbi:MAG: hypothetical protein L6R41_006722 [Letrouitia leprolyta]|nr:MAG: hypothetical protein L6R41_006722 [Letrouitia leprolyta]